MATRAEITRWLSPLRRRGGGAAERTKHADRLAALDERPYKLTPGSWEVTPTFGFDFLADAIAKVIVDTDPQLTLAIYGNWGQGKTTLLHAIEERLKGTCAVAWFDMWEYKNQQ